MKKEVTEKLSAERLPAPTGQGRRKFLKGTSLALPAVMTLHIQSVSATSTSSFRCTENFAGQHFVGVKDTEDGCARESVKVYSDDAETPTLIFLDDTQSPVVRLCPDGEPYSDNNGTFDAIPSSFKEVSGNYYALVRYDENTGEVVSLGVSGDGADSGIGIAASAGGACWLSVSGGTV